MFGQSNIVEEIKPLLKPETIDEAEKKVNGFLQKDPNNVDALMMKGNIIYYQYTFKQPDISLAANPNESIYDNSIGFMSEPILILPKETADQITEMWLKAVSINKKREDIHLGICHIYSISLQTDKLINYLPVLKDNTEINSYTPYNFADYARNLEDRGKFDDAIKVYLKISELFPRNGGLLSDIAGEYFSNGDLAKAKEYADAALTKPDVDAMTYGNAFFIYAVLEDYPAALKMIRKKSEEMKNDDYLFYQGLVELNEGKEWKLTLKKYSETKSNDTAALNLTRLLLSETFDSSIETYKELIQTKLNDAYRILIHAYYKNHTKEFLPAFNYAEAMTYNHRYRDAIKTFQEIETDKLSDSEKQDIYFYLAWAYYKNGNLTEANQNWDKLINSDNFLYKSAACYFIGKYYLDNKNREKANEYFSLVSDKASESKYATYCWNLLKK